MDGILLISPEQVSLQHFSLIDVIGNKKDGSPAVNQYKIFGCQSLISIALATHWTQFVVLLRFSRKTLGYVNIAYLSRE